jgi:hypothetical protein
MVMGYPPVKLMEKPRHGPGGCSLPMDQEGQNGIGDGPQNKNVAIVAIMPTAYEKAVHHWYGGFNGLTSHVHRHCLCTK